MSLFQFSNPHLAVTCRINVVVSRVTCHDAEVGTNHRDLPPPCHAMAALTPKQTHYFIFYIDLTLTAMCIQHNFKANIEIAACSVLEYLLSRLAAEDFQQVALKLLID